MATNASSSHNAQPAADRRARKKQAVVGPPPRKAPHWALVVAIVAVVAAAAVATALLLPSTRTSEPVHGTGGFQSLAAITFPVDRFADGQARHFQYAAGDVTVRYFVMKSADGVIRAAFDACDVCWPANKGYYQDGDVMVCRNCGRRFASTLINEVKGGCNPAPLARTVRDGQVVIKVEDILAGRPYFTFADRS